MVHDKLKKRLNPLGERIIWNCLKNITSYYSFKDMKETTEKFLNKNYPWLQDLDKKTISLILEKWSHSYFDLKRYKEPSRPSLLIGYPLIFGGDDLIKEDIFKLVLENESEYIDSLNKTY